MKVMALKSSPRGGGQSKTETMLKSLVEGLVEAGTEVEVVDLRKKKVNNCAAGPRRRAHAFIKMI